MTTAKLCTLLILLSLLQQGTPCFAQQGGWKWAQALVAESEAYPSATAMDTNGDVVITGYYRGALIIGSETLTSIGDGFDVFTARYNKQGVALWARSFGFQDRDVARSIHLNPNGDVTVLANFASSIALIQYTLDGRMLFARIAADIPTPSCFAVTNNAMYIGGKLLWKIARKDSSGVWTGTPIVLGDSLTSAQIRAMVVDNSGRVYIAGSFSGEVRFGNTTLVSSAAQTSDGFLACYDSSGIALWATSCGGTDDDIITTLCFHNNSLYCSGWFRGTCSFGSQSISNLVQTSFVARYSTEGTYLWSKLLSPSPVYVNAMTSLPDYILLCGSFSDSLHLGNQRFSSAGGSDIFVATLDSNGVALGVLSNGSTSNDVAQSVHQGSDGTITVCGYSSGTLYFDSTRLSKTGTAFPFIAQRGRQFRSTLRIPHLQAKAGYEFSLPVLLEATRRDRSVMLSYNITDLLLTLRFRSTIMAPLDNAQHGTVENSFHTLTVRIKLPPLEEEFPDTVALIRMIALLGDTDSTAIEIMDIQWLDAQGGTIRSIFNTTTNGSLHITNIWYDGNTPRYIKTPTALALEVRNNPSAGEIDLDVRTDGLPATLRLYDESGRLVCDLSHRLQQPECTLRLSKTHLPFIGRYFCQLVSHTSSLTRILIRNE